MIRLLGGLGRVERHRDAALAHHHDPVADADHLGQLRRDHDDRGAARREVPQQRVDLALCPDVDATRRLVDEQDPAPGVEPLREDDLLLVAAGQVPDPGAAARGPDRQPVDVTGDDPSFAVGADHARRRDLVHPRDRHVRADCLQQQESVGLAVLGQQPDPERDRVARRPDRDRLPEDLDRARIDRVGAVDRAQHLGPAGAGQPGDPDDLPGSCHERRHRRRRPRGSDRGPRAPRRPRPRRAAPRRSGPGRARPSGARADRGSCRRCARSRRPGRPSSPSRGR